MLSELTDIIVADVLEADRLLRPMAFLDELAANMSAHGVSIALYAGNDDSLVAHRGTEGALLSLYHRGHD